MLLNRKTYIMPKDMHVPVQKNSEIFDNLNQNFHQTVGSAMHLQVRFTIQTQLNDLSTQPFTCLVFH